MLDDYFIFVFVAALGVLQAVAAYSRLDGLLFLRRRRVSVVVGCLGVILAFVWFFSAGHRNIPDTDGGLDGNAQAVLFVSAVAMAVVVTFGGSSLFNRHALNLTPQVWGLDALRYTTYVNALRCTVNFGCRIWRQWIQRYSSG